MVRRLLKRGHSLDRFLSRRRMSSSSSISSSSSSSLSSPSSSKSGRMEEEAAAAPLPPTQKRALPRSHGSRASLSRLHDLPPLATGLPDRENTLIMASRAAREGGPPSDMDLMKEKFWKLLLGEDMSGSGKGVSSALALSNAITNLAASVFGEQRRLEPMSADRKARWNKEIDWLLSVTDHIVEFVPSQQVSKDGTNMEIMMTQQRRDLHMNIPALRKVDAMLLVSMAKPIRWYVSKDADESEKSDAPRKDDKWWIPTVRVSPDGLSDASKKWLQHQKDLVGQVLEAVMAINANVLLEMEIPEAYIESLPKNGRSSLGDSIYKIITDNYFDPNELQSSVDLSTEHKIVDFKDRIEASVVIWQRKMCCRDSKMSWGASVSFGKREQLEEREQIVLLILKHRFPGLAQSSLDISKIQYNRDVGYAILESYPRTLESLAFVVMSRIEDVLYANSIARDPKRVPWRRRPSLTDYTETAIEMVNSLEADPATLTDLVGLQSKILSPARNIQIIRMRAKLLPRHQ